MKKKLILPIAFFMLFLIFISGLLIYLNPFQNTTIPSQCGSLTALSIDKAQVTTSSDLGGKEVVRVTAVGNSGGECLQILWDAEDLEEKLSESGKTYNVDNSVYGYFGKTKQTQTFTAIKDKSRIYRRAELKKVPNTLGGICFNACENAGITDYWDVVAKEGVLGIGGECYCAKPATFGEDGYFNSVSQQDFSAEFNIDGLGSATVNSLSDQSAKIGNRAFIKWAGNLVGNKWNTVPSYDVMFWYDLNTWRLIKDQTWSSYETLYYDMNRDDKYPDGWDYVALWDYNKALEKVSKYNAQFDNLVTDKTTQYKQEVAIASDIKQSGANLVLELDYPLTLQVYTIDLDATFVGIHKVEGVPKLTCPTNVGTVNSGDIKTVSFTTKNDAATGAATADFSLGATCTNGGDYLLSTNNVLLSGQQSKSVSGMLSILVPSGTRTSTCTLTMKDKNSLKSTTCNFAFTGKFVEGCTQDICYSEDLLKCNQETGETTLVECQYGCIYRAGTPECSATAKETICDDKLDNDNDGLIDAKDPDCGGTACGYWLDLPQVGVQIPNYWCLFVNWLKDVLSVIAITLGVISGILALLTMRGAVEKFGWKQETLTWVSIFILSLIIGFLVGYLVTQFWWAGVIALIVLVVLKIIF